MKGYGCGSYIICCLKDGNAAEMEILGEGGS